ncbi:MAG: alanine--tRNA ligase, partial [Dehalococcoidia bacterium]|nr:alanine--tRNA ligase [Dehalococcoidia bacterium]
QSIAGADAFRLYDTYGLPRELTQEIAAGRGFSVDSEGFERELEAQRQRARASQKFAQGNGSDAYQSLAAIQSDFVGYDALEAQTTVAAILDSEGSTEALEEGADASIVLPITPFYPEGGGQVGDSGQVSTPSAVFLVADTQRVSENLITHAGRLVKGSMRVGDSARAEVDAARRADIMRNHTATHLVHAALRTVLGDHVRQTGSLVAPERLRFDFSHGKPLTGDETRHVERLVNAKIRQDVSVSTRHSGYQEAIAEGVVAFFGEKYGEQVRVVEVPNGVAFASAELCGGTHCHRTGQVGYFVIVSEGSVGAGMRRIEALTGAAADEWVAGQRQRLHAVAEAVGGSVADVTERVQSLREQIDQLRKRLGAAEKNQAVRSLDSLLDGAAQVNGSHVLTARVEASSADSLRALADGLKERIESGVVVLGSVVNGKPAFLAVVTRDLVGRVHAGNLVKEVAALTGGGGGGRPDMAQAGGKDPARLDDALALAGEIARRTLTESSG